MNNNNSNIITWQDPRIDMTTGKTDDCIASVLSEVKCWENIPDRQEPLTVDMIHYQNLQHNKNTPHSEDAAMYDWEVFGIYAGNRLSEWAQYDGKDIVVNINGTANAFTITNLKFFGENRRHMSFHDALQCPHFVHTIDLTWRFQKNGNNGEKKTFVRAFGHPTLCAVSALLRIAKHWNALGLPKEHPLAVYTTDGTINGKMKLISESNINATLRNAARNVYNVKGDNLD
jgi:hypothetical protein